MKIRNIVILVLACALAPTAHAAPPPASGLNGIASWYGHDHAGKLTANGERFNPNALTAAHKTLPLGSRIRVTDVETGRSVDVRVNDRGPYVRGRVVDLSEGSAKKLGLISGCKAKICERGVKPVRIEILSIPNPPEQYRHQTPRLRYYASR